MWEHPGARRAARAREREPDTREALFAELDAARGGHAALDRETFSLRSTLDTASSPEALASLEVRSRYLVERMALALQAPILLRAGASTGSRVAAEAFTASRLDGDRGLASCTLSPRTPFPELIDRALT